MTPALPLVAILGPTASGKSALAVRVARQFGGEVVLCDSTQLYRYFDIGTAKVPQSEQQGIPHHLYDLLEPHELFTAGDYRRRAIAVLADLRQRGKLPVFTAGTGLYLRALLEGLSDAPARSEALRQRLRDRSARRGPRHLHRILTRLDPASAARIAPQDSTKVIRAIEICMESGRPMSEVHRQPREKLQGYRIIKIGLAPPRQFLYHRIAQRTAAMLAAGWLEEVRALVARSDAGHSEVTALPEKPFQFIGYSELRAHLQGELPLEAAVAAIEQATRRYAKRQITWFRREENVEWFAGFGDDRETANAVLAYLITQFQEGGSLTSVDSSG